MLVETMTWEEVWKEARPAQEKIFRAAGNIVDQISKKKRRSKDYYDESSEEFEPELHSVWHKKQKYYYLLRIKKLTRHGVMYRIGAVFTIMTHRQDGRKYFLQFYFGKQNPSYKTYEFHFIKRYAERKQKRDIRWSEEDFVEAFKEFNKEHYNDPTTIYLVGKGEIENEYEFLEKSSAGIQFGLFYDHENGSAYIKYKTFVCGEEAREIQKKYMDAIVFDAWANKVLGKEDYQQIAVVNHLDEDKVRYLI